MREWPLSVVHFDRRPTPFSLHFPRHSFPLRLCDVDWEVDGAGPTSAEGKGEGGREGVRGQADLHAAKSPCRTEGSRFSRD